MHWNSLGWKKQFTRPEETLFRQTILFHVQCYRNWKKRLGIELIDARKIFITSNFSSCSSLTQDFHALINDLEGRITIATTQHPLIIYIDGPDKLSDDYKARSMMWLPSNLPENVKIVVSCTTLEEEKTDSLKALKVWTPFVVLSWQTFAINKLTVGQS